MAGSFAPTHGRSTAEGHGDSVLPTYLNVFLVFSGMKSPIKVL